MIDPPVRRAMLRGRALGHGSEDHTSFAERVIRADPVLMAILLAIQDLPDARLVAGCLYQSLWNVLTERPRGYGIKDYDVANFDASDLSWEAENRVIVAVGERLPALADRIEVRDQARVHLWYETRFGVPYAPLSSTEEAIDRYVCTTHKIGVRLAPGGDPGGALGGALDLYAPGLEDIMALRLRPNRQTQGRPTYEAKARRLQALWPELSVEPW